MSQSGNIFLTIFMLSLQCSSALGTATKATAFGAERLPIGSAAAAGSAIEREADIAP
jgi:hypothetical protein